MSKEYNQEFVFVWKIQNFSRSFHGIGDELNSPDFTIESLENCEFFLKMYPHGRANDENISIFLYKKANDTSPKECKLLYELRMIGGDELLLETTRSEYRTYDSTTDNWGFIKFFNRKKVTDKMENWSEDILTLRCRMFFNSQKCKSEIEARTEIGVDRQIFVWNVKIATISSQSLKKELLISKEPAFDIILNMLGAELKIDILSRKESAKPKSVSCKMALVDSKGKELISKSANHLFKANCENEKWEYPVFISKTFLDDNKAAFVENGTICLVCKWISSNGIVTNTTYDSNSSSSLQMQFENMLLDTTYSDINLKVGNDVLHAHKCVLAVCSPVFSAMFQQDMIESKTSTVDIADVEASTLKTFLKFIYTNKLENLEYETGKKLLLVAEKYQVLTLKEKCLSFLESVLSLGNVLEVLSLADMIGHESLKCAAVNIIVANSEIVLNLPEWTTLIHEDTKLSTEIISKIVCSKIDIKKSSSN